MLAVVASRNKVLAGVTGRLALTGVPGRKRCWQEGRAAGRWQERPGRRQTGRCWQEGWAAGRQAGAGRQVLAGGPGRKQARVAGRKGVAGRLQETLGVQEATSSKSKGKGLSKYLALKRAL